MSNLQEYWDAAPELAQRMAHAEDAAKAELEALRKDAERYRKLCDVPGALDAFTAAYHNTQTKVQLDAAVDRVPAVGAA